jgi:hypothetical protein
LGYKLPLINPPLPDLRPCRAVGMARCTEKDSNSPRCVEVYGSDGFWVTRETCQPKECCMHWHDEDANLGQGKCIWLRKRPPPSPRIVEVSETAFCPMIGVGRCNRGVSHHNDIVGTCSVNDQWTFVEEYTSNNRLCQECILGDDFLHHAQCTWLKRSRPTAPINVPGPQNNRALSSRVEMVSLCVQATLSNTARTSFWSPNPVPSHQNVSKRTRPPNVGEMVYVNL